MKKKLEKEIEKFDNELNPIEGLKILAGVIELDYKVRKENREDIPDYLFVYESLIKAFAEGAEENKLDGDTLISIAIRNTPSKGCFFRKVS